jgi:hypothetical protein
MSQAKLQNREFFSSSFFNAVLPASVFLRLNYLDSTLLLR